MLHKNYSYKIAPIDNTIEGEISVSGAKNSILPIICASLLNDKHTKLYNVPNLNDVNILLKLLEYINVSNRYIVDKEILIIDGFQTNRIEIDIMSSYTREIRYSLLLIGALLGKGVKKIKINLPGGCDFSDRPYDIHLKGFEKMGCSIIQYPQYIDITVKKELRESEIELRFPSVGATENLILGACGVKGVTILNNIAIEPEIIDLINYLRKLNVKIDFISHRRLKIDSKFKKNLNINHRIIPDRIEAISWITLATLTSKKGILIKNIDISHLFAPLLELQKIGIYIEINQNKIFVKQTNYILNSSITSNVYPYLGTDYLPLFAVLLSNANNISTIKDNIYPKRFEYLDELSKMGLRYSQKDGLSTIQGETNYISNHVKATDLRGGFATLLAGIISKKETLIDNAYQIERGYANLIKKMNSIGITITKIDS